MTPFFGAADTLLKPEAPPHALAAAHLFTVDSENPRDIAAALENFLSANRNARENSAGPVSIAHDVVKVVARGLWRQFEQIPDTTPDQAREMSRALRVLKALAKQLDEFSRTRKGYKPEYHDNDHNPLVMAVSFILGRAKLGKSPWTADALIRETYELIAALNHDNAHDGTTNKIRKVGESYVSGYISARLEMISYNRLGTILEAKDVPDHKKDFLKWLTYSTDPELPGEILKYAYAWHFDPTIPVRSHESLVKEINTFPPADRDTLLQYLDAMEKDPSLAAAAMRLKAADMTYSYGLSRELWIEGTQNFHDETMHHSPDKPVVDASKKPKPEGQFFVMHNCIGARINAEGKLYPCFLDPTADEKFGGMLKDIDAEVKSQLSSKKKLQELQSNFLNTHQPLVQGSGLLRPAGNALLLSPV